MTRKAKILIAILTFVVFAGVGFLDANRRLISIEHRHRIYHQLCLDQRESLGASYEGCGREALQGLEGAEIKAIVSALPIGLGAAAIFLVLALVFVRFRGRKRDERLAD